MLRQNIFLITFGSRSAVRGENQHLSSSSCSVAWPSSVWAIHNLIKCMKSLVMKHKALWKGHILPLHLTGRIQTFSFCRERERERVRVTFLSLSHLSSLTLTEQSSGIFSSELLQVDNLSRSSSISLKRSATHCAVSRASGSWSQHSLMGGTDCSYTLEMKHKCLCMYLPTVLCFIIVIVNISSCHLHNSLNI